MVIYEKRERIARLREAYMHCPMMREKLSYTMDKRQRYLFLKGWFKSSFLPTTLQRRSFAYAYVLENMKPVISEDELIVGQPDFSELCGDEEKEAALLAPYAYDIIPRDVGRTDHMSLGFEKLITHGVDGLISEIEASKGTLDLNIPENVKKYDFYTAALLELRALLTLADRYAAHARALAEKATEKRRSELLEIAEILTKVPRKPAESFREALQSIHFYTFSCWGLYQCGHPDRYLYPYYKRDIESGALTPEEAQELIDCFCLMYTTYIVSHSSIGFMIGGKDENGILTDNELTYHFLNSIPHTNTADPSIGLCIGRDSDKELIRYASELLIQGYSHPAIYNDDAIPKALQEYYGVSKLDSHNYIHSCCVEITVHKKSNVWTVSPYHNTLLYFLDTVESLPEAGSVNELLERFADILRQRITEEQNKQNLWQLERSRNSREPLLVSCLIDDCLAKGIGIYDGGAVYNWVQPDFIGVSNVVESLLAIERLVFTEKRLSLSEFYEITKKNFEGEEALRREIIHKGVHFGCGNENADLLYKQVTDIIIDACKGINTLRHSVLMPSAFSYNEHVGHGKKTPASFDGRLAGEPLADGSGPVQGRDTDGPTSLLRSVTSWDQAAFLGGVAINLKLARSKNDRDIAALTALIQSFVELGGIELQVTATNAEELRAAMKDPEHYNHIIVRIGGYSDYFTSLSTALQEEVISRMEHSF